MNKVYLSKLTIQNIALVTIVSTFLFGGFSVAEEGVEKQLNVPFKFSLGMKKYQSLCSSCHGKWANGTKQGPPLMHPFYKPSHHNDSAFYRAILNGVTAHHWDFGNMPPVSGATKKDAEIIVPFIRWLQKEKKLY